MCRTTEKFQSEIVGRRGRAKWTDATPCCVTDAAVSGVTVCCCALSNLRFRLGNAAAAAADDDDDASSVAGMLSLTAGPEAVTSQRRGALASLKTRRLFTLQISPNKFVSGGVFRGILRLPLSPGGE